MRLTNQVRNLNGDTLSVNCLSSFPLARMPFFGATRLLALAVTVSLSLRPSRYRLFVFVSLCPTLSIFTTVSALLLFLLY